MFKNHGAGDVFSLVLGRGHTGMVWAWLSAVIDRAVLSAQLTRIEQELRENLRREQERQEALDLARQEENRERWRSLCYISLNQRVNRYAPPPAVMEVLLRPTL